MTGERAQPLTRDQILDAAVEVLRRHGLEKTAVVDVARALGMSHGSIYRHVKSKAELIDAVAERWLTSISAPLETIAGGQKAPPARLRQWFEALVQAKRRKVMEDPELFAVYHAVAEAAHRVVGQHVAHLRAQLARILSDGAARGDFQVKSPEAAAAAVFDATLRYHHPAFVAANATPEADRAFKALLDLLLAGLRSGAL
jgi:AcrR family transcriptional regulator